MRHNKDQNQNIKKKFIEKVTEQKINLGCPVCTNKEMIVEGPFSKSIQTKPGSFVIGGPSVPTMGVICKQCGYIREFALGSLGLLEELKSDEKNEKKS